MKIYNESKTEILEDVDLEKGYLKEDKLVLRIVPEQQEVKEEFHYDYKEYPNGGKDRIKVVDVPYSPYIPEYEEIENIQVYIPYTQEELLERKKTKLREWREEYFKIIDRATWYDTLSNEEKELVKKFRLELLDITKTLTYPDVPLCVALCMKGEENE